MQQCQSRDEPDHQIVRLAPLVEEPGKRRLDRRQVAEQGVVDDLVEIGWRRVGDNGLHVFRGDLRLPSRVKHELGDFTARGSPVGSDHVGERGARVGRNDKPRSSGFRIDERF